MRENDSSVSLESYDPLHEHFPYLHVFMNFFSHRPYTNLDPVC